MAATGFSTLLTHYGYPKSPGDTPWAVLNVRGVGSYTQITPGVYPNAATGGQIVYAKDFGLSELDFVWAMGSQNGSFLVNVFSGITSAPGEALTQVILQWKLANTGVEVGPGVDLAASTVRLLAVGR
jgi:hypothetical protein